MVASSLDFLVPRIRCHTSNEKQYTVINVSKIVSILFTILSDCPHADTSLCYCKYSHVQ